MLTMGFVFVLSQGNFFGSKIYQGTRARFEAAILNAHPAHTRHTLGLLPVCTSRNRLFLGSKRSTLRYITRRAQCHLQMLKPQLAVGDFKKVLAIDPNNKSVKQQMEATQKLVRKIEFEKVGQPWYLVTLII